MLRSTTEHKSWLLDEIKTRFCGPLGATWAQLHDVEKLEKVGFNICLTKHDWPGDVRSSAVSQTHAHPTQQGLAGVVAESCQPHPQSR